MSYLLEKFKQDKLWVCRVIISNTESQFFNFDHDPTYEEVLDRRQEYLDLKNNPIVDILPIHKTQGLIDAEKAYVQFCRYLQLPEPTGTPELDALCMQLKEGGKVLEAMEIAIRALALINNITQNGGKWSDINWNI